jgi:hypothetical protein
MFRLGAEAASLAGQVAAAVPDGKCSDVNMAGDCAASSTHGILTGCSGVLGDVTAYVATC